MRISLRSIFALVTIAAMLLALVAWRLQTHRKWNRIEKSLMDGGVQLHLHRKFDWGIPELFGIRSIHPEIADIYCEDSIDDAELLVELGSVKTICIDCRTKGVNLRAKLPSQVSAKYLVVVNEVPRQVYQHVANWRSIEEAEICTFDWTVDSARAISQSKSIRVLSCSEDETVDDDVAAELLKLPKLTEIDLTLTPVTDKTIERISRLPHLKRIDLSGSQVTLARVSWLRAVLPQTDVVFRTDAPSLPKSPVGECTPSAYNTDRDFVKSFTVAGNALPAKAF